MKYIGRIVTIVVFVVVFFITRVWIFYQYNNLILAVILLTIAWWLGTQYDKAKYYSEKDVLTELYNRRFVDNVLPMLLAQMDRADAKLCAAILDIDNFKTINDTLGHKKGDSVIKEVSVILSAAVRQSDLVIRWGGDEFLVVFPYTNKKEALNVFARLEPEIANLSQKFGCQIAVSIGIAVYPDNTRDLDKLIALADSEMYTNKNNRKQNS